MSEQNEQNLPMPSPRTSPFDSIRHRDERGDYWTARELMPLLEYSAWQKFEEAIQRAMADCARSGREVADNFTMSPGLKAPALRHGDERPVARQAKDTPQLTAPML